MHVGKAPAGPAPERKGQDAGFLAPCQSDKPKLFPHFAKGREGLVQVLPGVGR
jgi:hypothetical protein